ncbi:MAG TPA: glycosyltransferase family 4 protein, partial [Candidatus Kapabacteria bacterium]|nr:glycosyltransferase family 4 protein [Candidatus Kapabacteria bacterium]
GIEIYRTGSRSLFNFYVPKQVKLLDKKYNFDIIIDDINKIPFYTPLYVRKPILAISHHFFGRSIFREASIPAGLYVVAGEYLMRFVYKRTPFSVVSQSTLDEFIKMGYDKRYFTIIYNAIDHSRFPFSIGEKEVQPTVSYFGRLKKYKSVDHLLRAFAIVKQKHPQAKLHILGRGDFRSELEKLANELHIENDTIFFGFVSEKEKVRLLSRAWCVANTSMKEGWGITNLEANAAGTPVISANSPGLRDSVSVGQSGLLYEYGNIEELAEKIDKIFSDDELRKKLSEGAIDWAKMFSWDKSADEMLALIEKVIKGEFKF